MKCMACNIEIETKDIKGLQFFEFMSSESYGFSYCPNCGNILGYSSDSLNVDATKMASLTLDELRLAFNTFKHIKKYMK